MSDVIRTEDELVPPLWAVYTSMNTPFAATTSVFFTFDEERAVNYRREGYPVREARMEIIRG